MTNLGTPLAAQMPSIPISSLLNAPTSNSGAALVDLQQQVNLVAELHDRPLSFDAPPDVIESLLRVIDFFGLNDLGPGSAAPHPLNSTSVLSVYVVCII